MPVGWPSCAHHGSPCSPPCGDSLWLSSRDTGIGHADPQCRQHRVAAQFVPGGAPGHDAGMGLVHPVCQTISMLGQPVGASHPVDSEPLARVAPRCCPVCPDTCCRHPASQEGCGRAAGWPLCIPREVLCAQCALPAPWATHGSCAGTQRPGGRGRMPQPLQDLCHSRLPQLSQLSTACGWDKPVMDPAGLVPGPPHPVGAPGLVCGRRHGT